MGMSIDANVSIFAGDKHQEVLAWLWENDEERFDFHQPYSGLSGKTVITGNICEYAIDDEARAFFQAVHARFGVRILLDIKWPDHNERQLTYLGDLDLYPPLKMGDLAGDLDCLQAYNEALREKARAVLQAAWR